MKNDILICIFNYRHDDNARRWYNILSSHFDTYVLDSGNDKVNSDFIQYSNIYYSGLWNEMKSLCDEGNYKWVGIICSDVVIDSAYIDTFIRRLEWLLCTNNVGCWSLLGDLDGHSNRYVYTSYNGKRYRTFEGFFQFIKRDVLDNIDYVDTTINLYGHGIDYLTCYMSNLMGYINVCHEDIYIYHPNDKGYDGKVARLQGALYKSIQRKKYSDYMKEVVEYKEPQLEYEGIVDCSIDRKCVYTCITGNYDVLKDVEHVDGWDYICFTNMNIPTNSWQIRRIPKDLSDLSAVKQQRMIKILPYKYLPDYTETIWIDGNTSFETAGNIEKYYKECKSYNKPIVLKEHPFRNCVYDEMQACIRYHKETQDNIDKIRERYLKEGMPTGYGLYETGIMYRDTSIKQVNELMYRWAQEVNDFSHRDQLSISYVIWKIDLNNIIGVIPYSTCMSFFTIEPHKKNTYSIAVIEDAHNKEQYNDIYENSEFHEPSYLESDVVTLENEMPNDIPKILILIEKSHHNPIINVVKYEFSKLFDTKTVDCRDRDYSSVYRTLDNLSDGYDWVVLIKSNVSFEWASPKYFDSVCNRIKNISNRNDVGIYGLSLMNDYNNSIGGTYEVDMIPKQDQFVIINTKLLKNVPDLSFGDNFIGAGFVQYLGNLSRKLGYSTIVDCGMPIKLYSNAENYDNPTIMKYRNEFLQRNKIADVC